jgi:4-hydroxythreonine-4-phosphate dehydrogenase
MSGAIAVSMGDPNGIGLEIAVKAWRRRDAQTPPFVLIGDAQVADRAALSCPVVQVSTAADAGARFDIGLPVFSLQQNALVTPGRPSAENAAAVIGAIEHGVRMVREGDAEALVTLPIAKAALYEAGFRFPGHTEFIAELTADAPYEAERGPVMMLVSDSLKVALATIHEPLRRAPDLITTERVVRIARVTLQALRRDFGIKAPRLAVAGLNPHAGESGALGREDDEEIAPAVVQLCAEGWRVTGPHPADTLFHADARGHYDAVLAMYHDQGLIPLKTLDFWRGVNVTLGLPIVRTSPDHGVGFDIAGRGLARSDSFESALQVARRMAHLRAAEGA